MQLPSGLPRPIAAEQAARLRPEHDLEVPEGQTRQVGPELGDLAGFSLVSVETFSDLQLLGYVPRHLDERATLDAVRTDRATFRKLRLGNGCPCQSDDQHRTLRPEFDRLRELLQADELPEMRSTHPTVVGVATVVTRFERGRFSLIGHQLFRDIVIAANALLRFTPSVSWLGANDITIGTAGTLRFEGQHISARCRTLTGPDLDVSRLRVPVGWSHTLAAKEAFR